MYNYVFILSNQVFSKEAGNLLLVIVGFVPFIAKQLFVDFVEPSLEFSFIVEVKFFGLYAVYVAV